MIRDHYLSNQPARTYASLFDLLLIAFSLVVFTYGYFRCEGDGSAMLIVGYALSVYGLVRYLYHGWMSSPHYRSLIRKYEAALASAEEKESSQSADPSSPDRSGPA